MNASALVQKIWNFCHTLRDDGVGYGDHDLKNSPKQSTLYDMPA